MCKAGDLILVNNYQHGDQSLGRHTFVVINDEGGNIQGLDYELICNVMSSFKNSNQRQKKLAYEGNFEICHDDKDMLTGNSKDGFIKAEQLYFFSEESIEYTVIGNIKPEIFEQLIEFINKLNIDLELIIDNLQEKNSSK